MLDAVSRVYARREREVRALDGVSLAVRRGELVALTGPSGSGKSTLLHILGLLDTPSSGTYRFDGEEVARLEDAARTRRRNGRIGFVFQAFCLIPYLTIAANVELPLVYCGLDPEERALRASAALERVGLGDRRDHLPDELSGGEQQRAAIARAAIRDPDLLLADEPTGNLDDVNAEVVLDLFRELHRAGTTIVVVTHNARVAGVADRGYELRGGRLVGE
ncbi:MAG TPA: ABC transporter ATP-binding protein [Candidatus Bathyarchaeia archaeon]|nr:ABC transporter ATP-binding protein [Candidatus Bathyarchaeia archaeon]